MSAAGLLSSRVVPSYSGPPRRYYRITALGREVLAAWRETWLSTRAFVDTVVQPTPHRRLPAMTAVTPRTVEQYLDLLRTELQGADRALVQDALYDAEEHLRAELAQNPGETEEAMLGRIVSSYGAPAEVADAYRTNEATGAGGVAHAAAETKELGARAVLRRLFRFARLPEPRVHAARDRHRHPVLHVCTVTGSSLSAASRS